MKYEGDKVDFIHFPRGRGEGEGGDGEDIVKERALEYILHLEDSFIFPLPFPRHDHILRVGWISYFYLLLSLPNLESDSLTDMFFFSICSFKFLRLFFCLE